MTSLPDVAIIGGGAIGAACARELAATGRRVVCSSRGESGAGLKAAAGMLAPQIEAGPDDPALELGLAGRELYSSLAESLKETTGLDIGSGRRGSRRWAGK